MEQTTKLISAWIIVLLMCSCSGAPSNLPVSSSTTSDLSWRVLAADGCELPASTVTISPSSPNKYNISVVDPGVSGVELHFDASRFTAGAISRGAYYGQDDLYLVVTTTPGIVAVGGFHLMGAPKAPALLATVELLEDSSAPRTTSALPIGEHCKVQGLQYTDNGDGSITLNWDYRLTGDYSQDGEVNISDVTNVGVYFNAREGDSNWAEARRSDGSYDGEVNISDLTPIGQYYMTQITGYMVEQCQSSTGPFTGAGSVLVTNGVDTPWKTFSYGINSPADGWFYRVRAYHSSDESAGEPSAPIEVNLLPPGDNPVAVAAADVTSGDIPLSVNFNANGSSDNDGTIEQYLWDLDGDGTYETDATSTSGTTSHTYSERGSYNVKLRVVDNDGRYGTDTVVINATDPNSPQDPPEAYAYCMPNQGWAPLTVYFSAFGSTDDAGISTYQWDMDGDGIYETDATGDQGYASHTFNEPGKYYVRLKASDTDGESTVATTHVTVRDPAESTVDYWSIFDKDLVRRVDVTVSQANWDAMWADIQAELEVPADAVVFGQSLPNIGFRMKGNSSLSNPSKKKPWKIDTNAYVDGQDYENLKMLIFNNGFLDPSLAREMVGYEMLGFAGSPASNACYVEFWITVGTGQPEFFGVYTMVERVDKKYIDNRYGEKSGNLYKCKVGSNLTYHGESIEGYPFIDGDYCYAKETNEDKADYTDIIELCRVVDGTTYASPDEFAASLEGVFNVDSFLRYLAATLSHSNLDIYMYMMQNFYLYHNDTTGKFEWIPWDLNETWGTFGDPDANLNHPLYDLTDQVIHQEPVAPLFTRVMEVQRYRNTYAAYLDLMDRYFFNAYDIGQRALACHDLIEPYVKSGDPMYTGINPTFPLTAFDTNWNVDYTGSGPGPGRHAFGIKSFTSHRENYIAGHLLADL